MRSLLVLVCLLVGGASSSALPYTIADLGDLPGGDDHSQAYGINDIGQVVGYGYVPTSGWRRHAFVWDKDKGMQDLGTLGGSRSEAYDINGRGEVVGVSWLAGPGVHAFRWAAETGMVDLGDLPGGSEESVAYAANEAGQVVGYGWGANGANAVLWDADNQLYTLQDLPGGDDTLNYALDIRGLGVVAGFGHTPGGIRAFVWDANLGVEHLGVLPGSYTLSDARGINNAGEVVGYSQGSTTSHACLWREGVVADLGVLSGHQSSFALAINEHGQVVGHCGTSIHWGARAFLWDGGQMLDLQDLLSPSSGWALLSATDINNSGQIVGYGLTPSGQTHAFLATPQPPELAWLGIGDYMSDGVGPDTGQPVGSPAPTTFVFKVKYTDGTGNPPLRAQCVIQKRACTVWNRYEYVSMAKESGDIATGAVYSCSRQLPNEAFRYRFRFRAADGTWITGDPPCLFAQGPIITGKPKLCWSGRPGYTTDAVKPDSGPPGAKFKFQVLYLDSAGDTPEVHTLLIRRNGRVCAKQTMNALAGGDFRTGKRYQRWVRIRKTGTYEYRFRFRDASGLATGAPSGWHAGPVITGGSMSSATVTSLMAMPSHAGAQITFSLSSAAHVQARILNIAGRPVKTLCHARECEAGANTLLWNAQSDQGLPVPNGTYLVEITAKTTDASQSHALTQVRLSR